MLQAKGINSSTKEGKVRQITKKQQEKLLEQRKKEGNENALQKQQIPLVSKLSMPFKR